MCLYLLRSEFRVVKLRFPHKHDVRFMFTSSCLWEGSCLIYVVCVCLRLVVFDSVVLCFSSYCVPSVASFFGLSIFDCLFGIL